MEVSVKRDDGRDRGLDRERELDLTTCGLLLLLI